MPAAVTAVTAAADAAATAAAAIWQLFPFGDSIEQKLLYGLDSFLAVYVGKRMERR